MASRESDSDEVTVGDALPLPKELSTKEAQLNPYPWFKEMRAQAPVRYDTYRDVWDVFRYDDINEILMDDGTVYSTETGPGTDEYEGTPFEPLSYNFLGRDPPYHDRIRGALDEFFQPAYLRDRKAQLRTVAERQLDEALAGGPSFDFVADFAAQLPVKTICSLLGVPDERRDDVLRWSRAVTAAKADEAGEGGLTDDERKQRMLEMIQYFDDLVDRRRADPRDDIISALIEKEPSGEPLSKKEIVGTSHIILVAGNVTTVNFMTSTLWTVAEQGLTREMLEGELELRPLLEEVLRYRSPVHTVNRRTTQRVEIDNQEIPADERLELWLGSANRDEAQFDNPEEFVPTRRPNRHIAFGKGLHFCLGAPLSKLETELAYTLLFDHITDIDVDVSAVEPLDSYTLYGTRTLPVTVDPA